MNRKSLVVLVFLLVLCITPVTPTLYDVCPAIPAQPNMQEDFVISGDGDESDESITSFSETLTDDTLFYPDGFDTVVVASAGSHVGDTSYGTDYTDTHVKDDSWYEVYDLSAPGLTIIYLNFTLEGHQALSLVSYCIGSVAGTVDVWDGTDWDNFGAVPTSNGWVNFTISQEYVIDDLLHVRWYVNNAGSTCGVSVDYAAIDLEYCTLADSEHFAESFADVSEWSGYGTEAGDTMTSDDDVATIVFHDDDNSDNWQRAASIGVATSKYFEIRYKYNDTGMGSSCVFSVLKNGLLGAGGSTSQYWTLSHSATWRTQKAIITSTDSITGVNIYLNDAPAGYELDIDYLRIAPSTESGGWQHDGSTTEGVEAFNGGSVSSDGDYLSLTADANGAIFNFTIDTTAIAGNVDPDYYQFVEVKIHNDDVGKDILLRAFFGQNPSTILARFTTASAYIRANVRAITGTSYEVFQIWAYNSETLRVDWVKAYSIANWTVTQGNADTDDYIYVDSNNDVVFPTLTIAEWINLNYDPTLAVAPANYQVWNITTPDITYFAFRFAELTVGWHDKVQAESRGDWDGATGNIYDIQIEVEDSGGTLSAVKFIEDSTAPSVVRSFANPPEPDDDEAVTLSAVVTDSVEVYTVKINALTSPSGFSDTDYSMTEGESNLWTYEFSNLVAGYYCFGVTASDGANTNSMTEYAYISITVRESELDVDIRTFFGAGEDFEYMHIGGYINKDSSVSIYEWSDEDAYTETHTSSATAGLFNIAWEKLDTEAKNVNFSLTFTNGSLSYTQNGSYAVAQTTFSVDATHYSTQDEVIVQGTLTKLANYVVYEADGTVAETGSISTLVFTIDFNMWEMKTGQTVDFAIRFQNGSQVCWYNSSYYAINIDEYGIAPSVTEPSWAQDIRYWQGVSIIVLIIFVVVQAGRALFGGGKK